MPKPFPVKLRDGTTRWRVRLRDPARRKETSETFATKAEAQKFCDTVAVLGAAEAIARLGAAYAEQAGPTVDELFHGFIDWKATRVRSDRTVADYRRDYRNWIQQPFGGRYAVHVTEQDVQAWVESMVGRLSPKSIADRHSILFGIYGYGIRTKKVVRNPCIGTDMPKRPKSKPKGLRPAEWQALHIALRQMDADAADLALFLVSTGWRFSEATALSTYDVEDYGDGDVWVTMGWVIRRNAAGQHERVEDSKSDAGARRIRLGKAAAATVRRRLDTAPPGSLLFTTKQGSQWHHGNFLNRMWKPAVKAANLERNPTPHWLRHSQVYWLDMAGAPVTQIQKRIGHEHIETTTGTYGSMIGDVSPAVLDALDKFIGETPAAIEA
jgi:integrase